MLLNFFVSDVEGNLKLFLEKIGARGIKSREFSALADFQSFFGFFLLFSELKLVGFFPSSAEIGVVTEESRRDSWEGLGWVLSGTKKYQCNEIYRLKTRAGSKKAHLGKKTQNTGKCSWTGQEGNPETWDGNLF